MKPEELKKYHIVIFVSFFVLGFLVIFTLITEYTIRQSIKIHGSTWVPDSLTQWSHRPDSQFRDFVYGEYNLWYKTNHQGFRGPDCTINRGDDTTRILIVGDSFTFGYGVEESCTFSSLLEDTLNYDAPVQVYNCGTGGWGTSQQLSFLENYTAAYHPDLIILAYYDNDIQNSWEIPLYSSSGDSLIPDYPLHSVPGELLSGFPLHRWFSNHSAIYTVFRYHLGRSLNKMGIRTLQQYEVQRDYDKSAPLEEAEPYRFYCQLLDRLKQFRDNHDLELCAILIPSRESYHELEQGKAVVPGLSSNTSLIVERELTARGIPCLITAESWVSSGLKSDYLYYDHDIHWRPEAHRYCADVLSDCLRVHLFNQDVHEEEKSVDWSKLLDDGTGVHY